MRKKLITFVLSSLVFLSIVSPFISSTIYTETKYLIAFILIVNFIENFVDQQLISIPLQLISLYGLAYSYLQEKPTMILDWVQTFTVYVVRNLYGFFNRSSSLIIYDVGIFLVGLVLVILIKSTVRKQRVWYASAVILIYFFILIAFNNVIIRLPLYQLVISTILWRLWILYEYDLLRKPLYTLGTCVLVGLLFLASVNYPVVYKDIYTTIRQTTNPYRINLSNNGFYRIFQLNRVTGLGAYSGYSLDDSMLGGPLQMNYNTVFRVKQTKPTYWKLENKYEYSGKGWRENDRVYQSQYRQGDTFAEANNRVSESMETSTITYVSGGLPYIPLPFGNVTFDSISDFRMINIGLYSIEGNRIGFSSIELPSQDQSLIEGMSYSWHELDISEEDLRNVVVPESMPALWVQIPSSVSQSVKNLASEITVDAQTQYDKVEAVRKYLAENDDFKYALESVAYTPDTMEFVYHFLFETKEGYCEHYSTAMVVLLRSLGIPARWAKGYSTGVISSVTDQEYTIRNADAHAWAEVYFDGYGWIPFEATPTFNFDFLNQESTTPDQETPTPNPSDPTDPDQSTTPDTNNPQQNENPSRPTEIEENVIFDFNKLTPTQTIQYGIMILGVMGLLYYVFKRAIRLMLTHLMISRGKSYQKTFVGVLKCLEWQCARPQHVGVELYGEMIPEDYQNTYKTLVKPFLDIRYGNHNDRALSVKEKQAFRKLLKCVSIKRIFFTK